jgi:hypothetical protein
MRNSFRGLVLLFIMSNRRLIVKPNQAPGKLFHIAGLQLFLQAELWER